MCLISFAELMLVKIEFSELYVIISALVNTRESQTVSLQLNYPYPFSRENGAKPKFYKKWRLKICSMELFGERQAENAVGREA